MSNGTFGLDVRNADGLIVISDSRFGFWALHLDGFDGWNGHNWGCLTSRALRTGTMDPTERPSPGKRRRGEGGCGPGVA